MVSVLADRLGVRDRLYGLGLFRRHRLVRRLGLVDRVGAGRGGVLHDLVRSLLLLAAERRSEVAQSPPQCASHFGQPLGAKHEQRNHEYEDQMCRLQDVAYHSGKAYRLPGWDGPAWGMEWRAPDLRKRIGMRTSDR